MSVGNGNKSHLSLGPDKSAQAVRAQIGRFMVESLSQINLLGEPWGELTNLIYTSRKEYMTVSPREINRIIRIN